MGDETLISWADKTHNHWVGCMKVGPGCDGCYAEHLMDTRMGRVKWGAPGHGVGTRALTSEANRRKPLAWNRQAAKDGTRPFVFCSSLADVFDNAVPTEWRVDLFELIRATPHLTWLLLTKRPQNIVRLFMETAALSDGWPWPVNAAIGCTVVSQEEADRDVPKLLAAKAALDPAFAFLSMEPLLGPVDLRHLFSHCPTHDHRSGFCVGPCPDRQRLDWCISGGETDQGKHKARPSHPDWFKALRDQCAAAGVAHHHKQNGEWAPLTSPIDHQLYDRLDKDGGVTCAWPDGHIGGGTAASCGGEATLLGRVGKKTAGRLLDGREHNDRPIVSALQAQGAA